MSKNLGENTSATDQTLTQNENINIDSDHGTESSGDDEVDLPVEQCDVPVVLSPDIDNYKMNHLNRGYALIFNHKKYDRKLGLPMRKGTDKDRDNLKAILKTLRFEVHCFKNFTVAQIEEVLNNYSNKDHTNNDCILIAVFTHGKENGILYAKDTDYETNTLSEPFMSDRCPSLAGKPKIIILQACKGSQADDGTTTKAYTDSADNEKPADTKNANDEPIYYSIPTTADFILAYATTEDYCAYRNETLGSIFIRTLCEELKDIKTRDFLKMLVTTNRRIAFEYVNSVPYHRKQMPSFTCMLTRNIYFN